MIRDLFRAALAALVLWPASRPAPPPAPAPFLPPPPVAIVAPPWPAPPPAGPVRRVGGAVLDAADRLAARWLP